MYSLRSALVNQPIISLQTGQIVGHAGDPLLEVTTLEVIAFLCQVSHGHPLLLLTSDIRQYAGDCIIIDSEDELTSPHDIVRLSSSLKDHYSPLGKLVISDIGRKLGVVEDYSINLDTHRVQKLHIRKSLIQAWIGSNLIIDRTQIIDITPERITVRDSTVTNTLLTSDTLPET